jgi:toxin ParE1/3/4
MEVIYSKGAREDIKESASYYENEVEGLGKAFLETIQLAIESVRAFPYVAQNIRKPYRQFIVKRFPFGIIYRFDTETIYITAVAHLKRKPYYWFDKKYFSEE